MSRFAQKKTSDIDQSLKDETYEHGFAFPTEHYQYILQPGLNEGVVREISHIKNEPDWMLQRRLVGLKQFFAKPVPTWGGDVSEINYDAIRYYLRPTDRASQKWSDVPKEIQETFNRIGVPQAEKDYLAGVKMQYDSEVVYGSLRKTWEKDGVIFLSMDEGLQKYPELVKEYFGKLIPAGDNKFSALNTAVWSGGSFVYVPKNVEVKMPLQTYFRINAANAGQFERTLIIVDEGAKVHYVEGCFVRGTSVVTERGPINIEDIQKGEYVLTHAGKYKEVYKTQVRPYSGKIYTVIVRGNPNENILVTEEHPFLIVKRERKNERNRTWNAEWIPIKDVLIGDYACIPIDRTVEDRITFGYHVPRWSGRKKGFEAEKVIVPSTSEFFRLVGYYLAEGSVSANRHYLHFSFNENERKYIEDVKQLVKSLFKEEKISEQTHKTNHGTSVIVSSTKLCRIFQQFGTSCYEKQIPTWMMRASLDKQKALLLGWFRGDGNYYNQKNKYGRKEIFRLCTTSSLLASQARQLLARLDIASSLNIEDRAKDGREKMHMLVIGGEYVAKFGEIVGKSIEKKLNGKKRATYYYIDEKYFYVPISSITESKVKELQVYNFSVKDDESYVAGGVAVHNCTAPSFSASSLHSAVVEIFIKKGARCQYTTVQNWYKNIYNLVTKRAWVEEEGQMVWTDFNMGSKLTMKYPSFLLAGKGARGETLSMALAGSGQHQDTGSKAYHMAPHTSSTIISKSISKNGGRTSYRGLINVAPQAYDSKNTVICDALLLDSQSRSDTYPTERIFNSQVQIQHEATVSKIGEEQLFYLMSRGVTEETARKMIVNGFVDDIIKKLPLEYAVEMNRLIDHEMEGSIG